MLSNENGIKTTDRLDIKPLSTGNEYMDSVVDGTWRNKWAESQPKPAHLLNHRVDYLMCTCGTGPFKEMMDWVHHVVGDKVKLPDTTASKSSHASSLGAWWPTPGCDE